MVDVMSAKKRSALMSRIRGKDTRPELLVRKYLWHAGFRYRLHSANLPGRPDLLLRRWGAAIFVHGCFWHRHEGCRLFRLPRTRPDFWDQKLRSNQARDRKAVADLIEAGWRVGIVWECSLRTDPQSACEELVTWIRTSAFHRKGGAVVQDPHFRTIELSQS
jgi:DNA mismatch endonuclease (patch repair protein)